jgi:hypothetical protein
MTPESGTTVGLIVTVIGALVAVAAALAGLRRTP